MNEYHVTINFAGYIGCDKVYTVFADSEYEAKDLAIQVASDDISVEDVDVEIEELW